jgi:hypothetical protein
MAPTSDRWQRLGERVASRRTQLGLTQGQVHAAGGPSVATMRLIEGALQDGYRGSILGRLEQALAWEPGSIDAILDGGEPTPMARPGLPDVEMHWERKLIEVESIANNPDRSPGLRAWARTAAQQIQDIIDAARAEEEAERRHRDAS